MPVFVGPKLPNFYLLQLSSVQLKTGRHLTRTHERPRVLAQWRPDHTSFTTICELCGKAWQARAMPQAVVL